MLINNENNESYLFDASPDINEQLNFMGDRIKKDLKGTVLGMNEAVVNGTTESGVQADQRLVGTDSHRQYAERLNPKSSWGKQFINKYRKK